MKVFLMHPDRDFDPGQVVPSNQAVLVQDLELNTLFSAMARGDEFLLGVAQRAVLSGLDAPDAIRYRQDILKDCLKNPSVIRELYRIPIQAIENKHKHWLGIFSLHSSGILNAAVDLLQMFVGLLKNLRKIAGEHAAEFESEGFRRFFSMLQQELGDDYFKIIEDQLKDLKFRRGMLISAQLGMGNEGTNYLLRKPNHNNQDWLKRAVAKRSPVFSYTLHPRDDAGAQALGELRDRGANLVANALGQSADHIDSFLNMLRLELAFYMGCLNLSEQLTAMGEPTCIPQPLDASERKHTFTGLYDVCLALTMQQKVVGNDLDAPEKQLFFITGANQGGKSTFLRSIGLAQLMLQSGMFVPAQSFSANLCRGIFTHFKREEDTSMKSGKFDEELTRMSAIVDNITPDSMILFNESFAATNEREGSEIARQIVDALLERRIQVFFVTHLFQLAHDFYKRNMHAALFLRAERRSGGERSFKLVEGEPLQTSYGIDSYNRIFR